MSGLPFQQPVFYTVYMVTLNTTQLKVIQLSAATPNEQQFSAHILLTFAKHDTAH